MARRRWFCGAVTVALAVLGLVVPRDSSAQTYLITELAAPSGYHTVATGLNDAGTVVGYAFTTAPSSNLFTSVDAFSWSDGTYEFLTNVVDGTIATGINNNGEIVGYDFFFGAEGLVNPIGFVELPVPNHGMPGGRTYINFTGPNDSNAYGINDAGLVVGEGINGDGLTHAFLFIPPTFSGPIGPYSTAGVKDLGTLGGSSSAAFAINNMNQVAGGSTQATGEFKAFLWTPFSSSPFIPGMNNLGAIASLADSIGLAISQTGKIGGMSFTGSANTSSRAVLFDFGLKKQFTPLSGGTTAIANGVNSFDTLVGASTNATSTTSATRATVMVNGKRYDLNTLIPSGGGWQLIEATAISDMGEITGYGFKAQNDLSVPTRGFILTPNFTLMPNTNIPSAMTGGDTVSNATVNLSNAIGIDVIVKLSSDHAGVHVPSSVVIPAGSTSATFTITTEATADGPANVTASLNGVNQTSAITMTAAASFYVTQLTLTPNNVLGGNNVTAKAFINAASIGTTTIPLSKIGFANGGMPGSLPNITIPNGATSGSVVFTTSTVTQQSTGTVRATLNGTADAALTINPLKVQSVSYSKSPVVGGDDVTVKVTLNAKAPPGGSLVDLSYDGYGAPGDPIGGLPPLQILIPAGTTNASFVMETNIVTTRKLGTVYAQLGSTDPASKVLTVDPIGVSNLSVGPNPASISGDGTATAIVTIERPAPAGGWTVQITSSSAARADFAPGATSQSSINIVIPAGATTSGPVTIYLNSTGTPNIRAQAPPAPASGAKSKTVSLSIVP